MRQLSLEDVVDQFTYDFLSDTHGGWENNDGRKTLASSQASPTG